MPRIDDWFIEKTDNRLVKKGCLLLLFFLLALGMWWSCPAPNSPDQSWFKLSLYTLLVILMFVYMVGLILWSAAPDDSLEADTLGDFDKA